MKKEAERKKKRDMKKEEEENRKIQTIINQTVTSCQEFREEEKRKFLSIFPFNDKNNVNTLIDKVQKT